MLSATDLMYQLETDILIKIAGYLKRGANASADYEIEKLKQFGSLNRQIIDLVKSYRDKVNAGVSADIEAQALTTLGKTNAVLGLNLSLDESMQRAVSAWQATCAKDINLAMAQLAENAGAVYGDIVSKASLAVVSGESSVRQSIISSVREWSSNGIPVFTDSANRQWSTEAYAQMVVRTNQRRVATDISFGLAAQMGSDLIEVDSHIGARPGCAPYQGRVFSISGMDPDYPAWSATSYGQASGLLGINCGHNIYPFDSGMRQTYKPIANDTNSASYIDSQRQRAIERSIRSAKRDLATAGALGDSDNIDYANSKVKDRQAVMRQFISDTNRTRRRDREQIYD